MKRNTDAATPKPRKRRGLALAVAVVFTATATATPAAFAKDACATFICMLGKLQGNNTGDTCVDPINDYFSIIDYHHGHVDFSATPRDRLNFLKSCPGGDPSKMDSINNAFGSVT
ncbi:TrbM/KikA/MpfK family conjugal transfer protein [Paraburkholderia sp. GAS32]|uniref:TrbM/KikA/MpfK family conjugal transfer protein n=1 Tax=Paraburkholderia sp. GAS32 TaxID=3035129 RepID=UPI003D1CFD1D